MLARNEWFEKPERNAFSFPLFLEQFDALPTNVRLCITCVVSLAAHAVLGGLVLTFG